MLHKIIDLCGIVSIAVVVFVVVVMVYELSDIYFMHKGEDKK